MHDYVQPHVSAENISLAHLLFEKALLAPSSTSGGKTFVISDPNPPHAFGDMYKALEILVGSRIVRLPPVLILTMSYCIELYCLTLAYVPFLRMFLSEPTGDLRYLQPACLNSSSTHQFCSDKPAQRSVEDGGLGYNGLYNTLEGWCTQIRRFKLEGKDY
jgi:hypothetical protein